MSALRSLPYGFRHSQTPDALRASGFPDPGVPRGRITEITGPLSSGRTTLLLSLLAAASAAGEYSAVVDASDAFDPASAAANGVRLGTLVWVRCGGNLEHAFRAADLLLHSGGFGVIALDLANLGEPQLSRIPPSYWFRFRRAVEPTLSMLVAVSPRPVTKSCATLVVDAQRSDARFSPSLFEGAGYQAVPRKPITAMASHYTAAAGSCGIHSTVTGTS